MPRRIKVEPVDMLAAFDAPITLVQFMKRHDIARATANDWMGRLKALGWVRKCGRAQSGPKGGQPAFLYSVTPAGRDAMGLEE